MIRTSSKIAATLLALSALPALAQQQGQAAGQDKPDNIVLESKAGSVMTSNGGAYLTAPTGKQLVRGENMMLNEGAKATVVYYYDNGRRKCVENYAGPNNFVIDDSCSVAAWAPQGRNVVAAGIIIGAGLLGAAIVGSMEDVPAPPVSAGAR